MEKVSIIIPVYNVEKYLEVCLESARKQTMKDIEIICVNDGSTDSSLAILEKAAELDNRIKIIDKSNSGYGNTMNIGINHAKGEYLVFLESDDFILPDMCETLYELCERYELEIAKADFYEFKTRDGEVFSRYRQSSAYNNYGKVLNCQTNRELFWASMYTWTCMYRRDFINRFNIRHNETPGASFQDNGFWFQTHMYCSRMYLLNKAFYMYRQDNPNSSIHNKGKVHAFSVEYKFISEQIDKYKGDKKELLRICAFFNIHHDMISLQRVDKQYTEELICLIVKDFYFYNRKGVWKIQEQDFEFWKKVLICLIQPKDLKRRVWEYIDKDTARKQLLETYGTLILYGAGMYARRILKVIEDCKMWNKEILCGVTFRESPDTFISDVRVENVGELLFRRPKALVIVCAKKGTDNYRQMKQYLEQKQVASMVDAEELMIEKNFWDLC